MCLLELFLLLGKLDVGSLLETIEQVFLAVGDHGAVVKLFFLEDLVELTRQPGLGLFLLALATW